LIFFFQAEDGIRDFHVTGVQTCALPISKHNGPCRCERQVEGDRRLRVHLAVIVTLNGKGVCTSERKFMRRCPPHDHAEYECHKRSEERRVGKEWRARWWS